MSAPEISFTVAPVASGGAVVSGMSASSTAASSAGRRHKSSPSNHELLKMPKLSISMMLVEIYEHSQKAESGKPPSEVLKIYTSMRENIQTITDDLSKREKNIEEEVKKAATSFLEADKDKTDTLIGIRKDKEKIRTNEDDLEDLKRSKDSFEEKVKDLKKQLKKENKKIAKGGCLICLYGASGAFSVKGNNDTVSEAEAKEAAAREAGEKANEEWRKIKSSKIDRKKLKLQLDDKVKTINEIVIKLECNLNSTKDLVEKQIELLKKAEKDYKITNKSAASLAGVREKVVNISRIKSFCELLDQDLDLAQFCIEKNLPCKTENIASQVKSLLNLTKE